MPNATPKRKTPARKTRDLVTAEVPRKIKARVLQLKDATGLDEGDFVRAAVEEFFAKYRNPRAVLEAVKADRARRNPLEAAA